MVKPFFLKTVQEKLDEETEKIMDAIFLKSSSKTLLQYHTFQERFP